MEASSLIVSLGVGFGEVSLRAKDAKSDISFSVPKQVLAADISVKHLLVM